MGKGVGIEGVEGVESLRGEGIRGTYPHYMDWNFGGPLFLL